MQTVGIVEAIVEGKSQNTGKGREKDKEQQAHPGQDGGSASVS